MANSFSITYLTLCAVGPILNGMGLYLLLKWKNSKMDLTQRYIIINLCIIDFSLSILLTIDKSLIEIGVNSFLTKQVFDVCKAIVNTGFYIATFWLIFDRFLHIKLNIKYVVYWSKKKTIIATTVLWCITTLSGSLIAIFVPLYDVLIYAIVDLIILSFSAFVYTYALLLSHKQRKIVRANQRQKGIFKGLLLSIVILTTFAVLVAIPDITLAIEIYIEINSDALYWYVWLTYPITFWTDALIYIFVSPQVRLAIKNKLKVFLGYKSVTIERSESYYIKS